MKETNWKKRLIIIGIVIIAIIVCRHTIIDWVIGTKDCGKGVHMISCDEGTISLIRDVLPDQSINIYVSGLEVPVYGGITIPPDSIIFYKQFTESTLTHQRDQLFHEYFHTQGPITRVLGWEGLTYNFYEEGLAEYTASLETGYYDFKCLPEGLMWIQGIFTNQSKTLITGLLYDYDESYGLSVDHYAKAYCLWKLTEERFGKQKVLDFIPVYHNITIGTYTNIELAYKDYFGVPPIIKPLS